MINTNNISNSTNTPDHCKDVAVVPYLHSTLTSGLHLMRPYTSKNACSGN